MKIKDLIKELGKLDGEKTIGAMNMCEVCKIAKSFNTNGPVTKNDIIEISINEGYKMVNEIEFDYYM